MGAPREAFVELDVIRGMAASREALLGFASARLLAAISFADVLDEGTGTGYQRRISGAHSLDFRRYIQGGGSTTIPLTFNLRAATDNVAWTLVRGRGTRAKLRIRKGERRVLAQVDCQHRLGFLADVDIALPFMILVGLTEREELEVFSVINSKARGLNSSLLDFHESRLVKDVALERPELLIALSLNDDSRSPWHRQLDLGGEATSGMKRRASLRTLQKAIRRFLRSSDIRSDLTIEDCCCVVLDFWIAVSTVLDEQWKAPRRHFLTKGVGVYALMGLLSDLWQELPDRTRNPGVSYFAGKIDRFSRQFDWSTGGPFKGLGGESGATAAHALLRSARSSIQDR